MRSAAWCLPALVAACAVAYRPCPVDVPGPLPADAFDRCREALLARYETLVLAQAQPLRLQTDWLDAPEVRGERRVSVFTDEAGLAVVVEVRWLREPWFGAPEWSSVRGDPAAEREVADWLRAALTSP